MNVIVVGGGAAGMMAAVSAAESGHNVTLIEKNEKLGKKIYITGKGRCNLTNSCDINDFFNSVITNRKFLYSALYGFSNTDVMDFFEMHGMSIKVERGGRVFPLSDHSSDVIKTLYDYLGLLGVEIKFNTKLIKLSVINNKISGVITDKGNFNGDAVILALGGKSYPTCGADGDTWKIFNDYNVKVNSAEPSLVPLTCKEEYVKSLQGLSLKNVRASLLIKNKVIYSDMGEMLFTHFGLSGPLILSSSCYLKNEDYKFLPKLIIDLKPALDAKTLDSRILNDFAQAKNKQFKNSLNKLLPTKLIPVIISLSQIDPEKKVHDITKDERKNLLHILKNLEFTITGNRGFNEAIITRGGVDVSEINPKTMELKKIKGLYVAGEMIDVDALTGGYNLQIAWSTGHLSGDSIS